MKNKLTVEIEIDNSNLDETGEHILNVLTRVYLNNDLLGLIESVDLYASSKLSLPHLKVKVVDNVGDKEFDEKLEQVRKKLEPFSFLQFVSKDSKTFKTEYNSSDEDFNKVLEKIKTVD